MGQSVSESVIVSDLEIAITSPSFASFFLSLSSRTLLSPAEFFKTPSAEFINSKSGGSLLAVTGQTPAFQRSLAKSYISRSLIELLKIHVFLHLYNLN